MLLVQNCLEAISFASILALFATNHRQNIANIRYYVINDVSSGAYREETTVNQVIGHGIEFSLPLIDPPLEAPTAQQHRVWCSD